MSDTSDRPLADTAPSGAPIPRRATSLSSPFTLGFMLTLGGLAAFVLGLAISSLSTILIYIAFALFAALGLDPVVRWLENHNVPRAWGMVIVFLGFALVVVGMLWLVIPAVVNQVKQFIDDVPSLVSDFQKTDFYSWLSTTFSDQIGTLLTDAQNFITNPSNLASIGGGLLKVGLSIATTISGLIIVLVLTLYFLASLSTIKASFVRLTPAHSRPKVASLTNQITDSIGSYLMGMVILAFFNSVFAFILHVVLGLPFPALLAVVAFCITIIPLVGTVMFWVLATTLALFSSPLAALIFGIGYLIYMQIEAYILTPRVMNKAISVPGALVVIGALVGGTLLGLLGALIAIPVTASILLIIKQVLIPRQDAKL
ncbi:MULTISPECIES: AI-2E family transporter [unclassified Microbacterium]|uniref:AI-2E family transporter n=1 Tax=unclassified Microbacterium TaxID=2609290 RepID=UPI00214AC39C|nr:MULTISPECIES: AI-2E family transporter [unclassified Microbacterium]MCR2783009.1 AI-2E family transporter [Microbacterium sp. zg.B96]MDL5352219.1 AI-2E family transporter [Microbacterium sp. zg-YB36]WIM16105.1 AI-2E family transporter [Microbacterium sp. zg-B96]